MTENSHICWRNGQPYSKAFDDVYFSTENGLAETEYVFLQGNQLAQRWAQLRDEKFTLIETGFGTGLNFLCALNLWLKTAPQACVLHYIGVEKYPLTINELVQAHQLWPQLATLSEGLHEAYPRFSAGCNHVALFNGRVQLTVWFDDVKQALPKITHIADAWFLDGFAPAKNSDMWHPSLFKNMARLSHKQTTFATFTSAGQVRRDLEDAGFAVSKRSGYGKKREMLHGIVAPEIMSASRKNETAIVIGAGIAGCSTAYALAKRGIKVTLLEQHNKVATEASGNAVGVLYPRLIGSDVQSEFSLASFLYTRQWLSMLSEENIAELGIDYAHCGMLQLAHTARELARFEALVHSQKHSTLCNLVSANEASTIAGTDIQHDALHIPSAAWIRPSTICQKLTHHALISFLPQQTVTSLQRTNIGWDVITSNEGILSTDLVIVANAYAAKQLTVTAHLPLQAVRGQVSHLNTTPDSAQLRCILCSDGYISPAVGNQHVLGASFVLNDTATDYRANEDVSNLAMLEKMSPTLYQTLHMQLDSSRAAIRCASPDHMPLAGPLMDAQALIASPPRYNASNTNLPWLDGLYVNLAHGSKGMTTAPFCAELIANMVTSETAAMDKHFIAALNPNRFVFKSLGLKQLIKTSAIR